MPKLDDLTFVADENFDFAVAKLLRETGYTILSLTESFFSIADPGGITTGR